VGQRRIPGTWAAGWTIAANDLRRARRDRTALLRGFIAPLLLAVLIGAALSNIAFAADIGLVDADGSALSRGVVDGLVGSMPADAPLRVRRVDSENAGRALMRQGTVNALIVIPAGFGASVTGSTATAPKTLAVVSAPRNRFAGDLAHSLADGIAGRIDTARLAVATALVAAPPDADVPAIVAAATDVDPLIGVDARPAGPTYVPIAYFGASMAVVFLFFTMGSSARGLLAERAEGTLTRVRSSPVSDRAILLGRSLSTFALGVAGLVTVWVVTTVAFGADWGDPVAVLAVIVTAVLAVAGISTLITGISGTNAQAEAYTTLVTFVLALLGGSFQPPGSLPGAFDQLALFTPNGLAQRAFVRIGAGDAGVAEVAPLLGALAAVAVVTLALGIRRLRLRVIA
jgi:ABC-2 type transport system permease protein